VSRSHRHNSGTRLRPAIGSLLLAGFLGLSVLPAMAGDWSAKLRFNQTVESSDNRALQPDSAGETYLSISRLRLDTVTVMPTSSFEFNADVSYQNLSGPGSDQNTSPTDNTLTFTYGERISPLTAYTLTGFWQRRDATTAQLADTGIVIVGGDINTFMGEAGITHKVSAYDEVNWTTRGTLVDFTKAQGTSFTDVLTTGSWIRNPTALTKLITSLQFEMLDQEAPSGTQALIGRLQTGMETQVSQQLSFNGMIGVSVQNTRQDSNAAGTDPSTSKTNVDGLADFEMVYLPTPLSQVSLSASHYTGPNVLGQVESRTLLSAALRQSINSLSNITLKTEYTGQIPVLGIFDDGDTSYWRAYVDYDYRLSPEWVALVSYKFAHRDDDLAAANSNTVYVSAVYETTILP
jgi:hypothetical protein